jgi:hypothetical protein
MSKARFDYRIPRRLQLLTAMAGLAVALPTEASAQFSREHSTDRGETVAIIVPLSPVQDTTPPDGLFGEQPLNEEELSQATGLQESGAMLALSRNHAVVKDNEVGDNTTTGAVSVSDNAFGNVSGFSMVNMNTGNNSAINAAMNINLQINYTTPGL